ncbi:MAG: hypothetical protein RIR73_1637 [Chloroflexota bacterium]|jgi:GGDEF domain-containing protein
MSELKQSIILLFIFIVLLLGAANVDSFQESFIDFSPVFFILIAIILFTELIVVGSLIKAGVQLSQYAIIAFWLIVYGLVWYFYLGNEKSFEVNLVQGMLVLLSAVLAFDVGRRINQTDAALERLAASNFPNRAMDIQLARNLVNAEITRSRRYHHPLSILTVQLEKKKSWGDWQNSELFAKEMMERFAVAKVSQILSDNARSNDMVLRDRGGKFVLLCPETNQTSANILASRIAEAVKRQLDADVECGSSSFPDEALTFDDLLDTASNRLAPVLPKEEANL